MEHQTESQIAEGILIGKHSNGGLFQKSMISNWRSVPEKYDFQLIAYG